MKNKKEIYQKIALLLEKKLIGKKVIAFPGGRSMKGIYTELKKKNINWSNVHIFMVDERMVSINNKESNFKLLKDNLLDFIDIPKDNVHPYLKDNVKYLNELKKVGGKFNIVVLSSGEDGHIAGLYPNHHSIKNNSKYFISMNDSPKLPRKRMSSSRKLIENSDFSILLFLGKEKKEAYRKYKDKNVTIEDCPAKIVNKNKVIIKT
tara:strand:+ start:819 stop:1436 length:618 start_codon:yes stop_codon:yes gene_type:complete